MRVKVVFEAEMSEKVAIDTIKKYDGQELEELSFDNCLAFHPKKPFKVRVFGGEKGEKDQKTKKPKTKPKRRATIRRKDVHEQINLGSRLIANAFGGFTVSAKTLVSFMEEKNLLRGVNSHTGKLSRVYAMMDKLKKKGLARERSRGERNTRRWYVKDVNKGYTVNEYTDNFNELDGVFDD
jgi:hypothetical protein